MRQSKTIPINMVGSTVFGRYPKISIENTYNMIISDEFLVPYAGSLQSLRISSSQKGRGIFASYRSGQIIAIVGSSVYSLVQVGNSLTSRFINRLDTSDGDVYIVENNSNQIVISDLQNIYVYNYVTGDFDIAQSSTQNPDPDPPTITPLNFIPGYITYQNERIIAAATDPSNEYATTWRLSQTGDARFFPTEATSEGELQTKPDKIVAAQSFPGRGNLLFVFGNTVAEAWQDVGAQLFPYQRNSSFNVDYGCLNPATIAHNDSLMVWIGSNEKSGPVLMYSRGGDIQRISTDGIDFRLSQLTNPTHSYGFLFRQDGHLIYQFCFPDDDLSYIYDFNVGKFFTVTDENMSFHPARQIAFLNDRYYFVSINDGHIYEMSSRYSTYNATIAENGMIVPGDEIPRIRVGNTIRMPDASRFIINNIQLTMEQGIQSDPNIPPKVFLSLSKDGGESFSSSLGRTLNRSGKFRNILKFWNLGIANDFVPQFRFYGMDRFVIGGATAQIQQ